MRFFFSPACGLLITLSRFPLEGSKTAEFTIALAGPTLHTTQHTNNSALMKTRISFVTAAFLSSELQLSFANAAFIQPSATDAFRVNGSRLHLKRGGTKKKKSKGNTISLNKLAYRNYEVLETLEVGVALRGTEVKRYVKRENKCIKLNR